MQIPTGWVKISQFEALTGLNNRTITLAISRGSIPAECWQRIGEGKTSPICIDPQPAVLNWYKHLNGNHHLTRPLRQKLANYIVSFAPDEISIEKGDIPERKKKSKKTKNGEITFAEAQRRKEVAKAKTAELELMQKEGSLILRQQVEEQLFAAGKEIRNALLAVPDRITDQIIASVNNRTQVNNIIYDAVADALEKLADLSIK